MGCARVAKGARECGTLEDEGNGLRSESWGTLPYVNAIYTGNIYGERGDLGI